MSADVPLHTVLDIDLYLVAAKNEAVTEQLHYLHSPFQTEHGYQTPGGLDIMLKHEVPCGGLSTFLNEGMPSFHNRRVF